MASLRDGPVSTESISERFSAFFAGVLLALRAAEVPTHVAESFHRSDCHSNFSLGTSSGLCADPAMGASAGNRVLCTRERCAGLVLRRAADRLRPGLSLGREGR